MSQIQKYDDIRLKDLPPKMATKGSPINWHAVDIQASYKDVLQAGRNCLKISEKERHFQQAKIGKAFTHDPNSEKVLTTLSVRSALDLYFQSRKFPKGSEVIMTAINIPDMYQIVREHGLVPVPLDLNIDTMEPVSFDAIKPLITDKTKVVIFAYLYGIRYDIKPYIELLKDKNIDIIEDVAQSFCGPRRFNGTPGTRMTLFSLGLIKVQTCFYGACAVIRDDNALFEEMRDTQETYPLFDRKALLKRIVTASIMIGFMNYKPGTYLLDQYVELAGKEREEFYISMVRGFQPQNNFLNKFRLNPCAPLLAFIHHRLTAFDENEYDKNNQRFQIGVERLTKAGIYVPGHLIKERGFWLFPIAVPNKVLFAEFLVRKGVNAYRGATQLRYITPLEGFKDAETSKWYMNQVIYLPLHSSMGDSDFNNIVEKTIESYYELMRYLKQTHMPQPASEKTQELIALAKL